MDQLYIYAAYFCLEYNIKPGDIEIETRLYHANDIIIDNPTAEDILPVMDNAGKSLDELFEWHSLSSGMRTWLLC